MALGAAQLEDIPDFHTNNRRRKFPSRLEKGFIQ